MAKITEKIDLTLNCYFAGDENKRLKPDRWRKWESASFLFFFERGGLREVMERHISSLIQNANLIFGRRFFDEPELHWTGYYYKLFRDFPSVAFEEMLGFGDPNFCPMCGAKVNLLTRNHRHDSCDWCYKQEQTYSMAI